MPSVSVEVDVDVGDVLDSLGDEELEGILKSRKMTLSPTMTEVDRMYESYRLNQKEKLDQLLRELFWDRLGRIV